MPLSKYLLPPYRCCGVSTRKPVQGGRNYHATNRCCDICGWVYKSSGKRAHNRLVKKHDRTEIDR